MTAILRQLPFQEPPDELSCGLERIPIKPFQIIVWVSLTARSVLELAPHVPRFPAILDTGHGHNFSLHERHATEWARLSPDQLTKRGRTTVNEQEVPLHRAGVWIHPNVPGQRDKFGDRPPFLLDLPEGITVHPGADFPRLPLLGLRALVRNKLHVTMDPERREINLRTPDWRTQFFR